MVESLFCCEVCEAIDLFLTPEDKDLTDPGDDFQDTFTDVADISDDPLLTFHCLSLMVLRRWMKALMYSQMESFCVNFTSLIQLQALTSHI